MPDTLLLILGEDIPGLVAVTPASAAAAKSACAMNRPGGPSEGVSLGFGINASGVVVGRSWLDKVFFSSAAGTPTAVNRGRDVVADSSGHTLLVRNGMMTELGKGEATASTTARSCNSNAQGHEHAVPLTPS